MPEFAKTSPLDEALPQELPQKPIWTRKKGENARWFLRFRNYLSLGPKRTLHAAVAAEQGIPEGAQSKASVPGSWKRACKQWEWVERAQAYDLHVQEEKIKRLQDFMNGDAEHLTRAQRLYTLNTMVDSLMILVSDAHVGVNDFKGWLAGVKEVQSLLRDIRREMAALEK